VASAAGGGGGTTSSAAVGASSSSSLVVNATNPLSLSNNSGSGSSSVVSRSIRINGSSSIHHCSTSDSTNDNGDVVVGTTMHDAPRVGDGGTSTHATTMTATNTPSRNSISGSNHNAVTTTAASVGSTTGDVDGSHGHKTMKGDCGDSSGNRNRIGGDGEEDGPPFTIQRVAEILVMPERYYTQTHKLCNGLEKLFLVTSSSSAFGGSTGGASSQSLREEIEIAALADERDRVVIEQWQRQRRLKRRMPGGDPVLNMNVNVETSDNSKVVSYSNDVEGSGGGGGRPFIPSKNDLHGGGQERRSPSISSPHLLNSEGSNITSGEEANINDCEHRGYNVAGAARASLQEKFVSARMENVGRGEGALEFCGSSNSGREPPVTSGGSIPRGGNLSPPPSGFGGRIISNPSSCESSPLGRARHFSGEGREVVSHRPVSNSNLARSLIQDMSPMRDPNELVSSSEQQLTHHSAIVRPPSPVLFSSSNNPVPGLRTLSNEHNPTLHDLQRHHNSPALSVAHSGLGSAPPAAVQMEIVINSNTASSSAAAIPPQDVADLDVDPGRSSASNSDVDSESGDDVSLDDSASDRSDGSDSGSGIVQHYEPFTAARVMALNRMQQQQRREQYLQSRALAAVAAAAASDGYRPPPDSEYQSGDSIDSMMAEDSGGSDSSNSDLAD